MICSEYCEEHQKQCESEHGHSKYPHWHKKAKGGYCYFGSENKAIDTMSVNGGEKQMGRISIEYRPPGLIAEEFEFSEINISQQDDGSVRIQFGSLAIELEKQEARELAEKLRDL